MRRRCNARIPLLACLLGAPLSAHALLQSCNVSATSLAFGAYNPLSASPLDTSGTVSVTCSVLLVGLLEAWEIRLSAGTSGTFASRQMANGANGLGYNIYTNAARSTVWGDGTSGTTFVADSNFISIGTHTYTYPIYGRAPVAQDLPAGSYSDVITVTLDY